ncbi:hypothetical protein EZS27_032005, partial [termite gut metagenome]
FGLPILDDQAEKIGTVVNAVSRESAPKSLTKLASGVTSDSSTPNLSTIIDLTLDAISDITFSF